MALTADQVQAGGASQFAQLIAAAEAQLAIAWLRSPGFRDEHIESIALEVQRVVASSSRRSVSVAVVEARRILQLLGLPFNAQAVIEALAGFDSTAMAEDAVVEVRKALANGADFETARAQGLSHLQKKAHTQITTVRNDALVKTYRRNGVKKFKRTLTGSDNCERCQLAAAHYYYKAELKPVHDRCDCGIRPARDDE